ncbi:unnamed protein product [Cylindrotheca closterium]|uniref:Uncharacterized protein n=1 Tax=Cylindrotheca closterium TaxID=2856 RepID=A0AAD2JHX7_9STRA|nr:unnamed protein product [Cylindrotheca closterium]
MFCINTFSISNFQLAVQALSQELAALRDKDDTVAFSNVTSTVFNEVMTSLDIEQVAAPWQNRPPCPQCDMTFEWGAAKEDNTENRKGYMAYLKELGFPDSVCLFDALNAKELLETDLPPTKPRMKGSIGVVVLAAHNPNISTAKHSILMGIELKKDKNQEQDKIQKQAVLQHCAASRLNHTTGVLTLMTDLNDRWHFYWFKQESRHLMKLEASRSEAVYLIKHFLDDPSENDSFPESFLTRAPWDSILGSMSGEMKSSG